jgi:hypothetical protein
VVRHAVTSHRQISGNAVTSAFTAIHPVLNRNQRRYHVKIKFLEVIGLPVLSDFQSTGDFLPLLSVHVHTTNIAISHYGRSVVVEAGSV